MDKYFTPSIEDIRIGYECEWKDSRGDWAPFRVLCPNDIMTAFDDELRTPYLTKEQIEAEGWEQQGDKSPFTGKPYRYKKEIIQSGFNEWEVYTMEYDGISRPRLKIHMYFETSWGRTNEWIYQGECKDINTFRYICKLLGI